MPETDTQGVVTADIARKESALGSAFENAFAALKGGNVPQVPQNLEVQAEPPAVQPEQPATQPAQPTTQPAQPATQPAQPTSPQTPKPEDVRAAFTGDAVTPERFKGMFSAPTVTPVEAQPATVPPDTPIAEPENMSDKAKNAWGEIRARERQLRAAYAEQQKKIEEFTAAQTKFQEEREQFATALKEKDDALKAATEKLGKLDLTGSIEFRQRYDQPLAQAEANLDAAIHEIIEGADTPEQIAAHRGVILSDDETFRNHVAALSVEEQGQLIQARKAFFDLSAAREQAIADWQATSRGLTEAAAQQNAAELALQRKNAAVEAIRFNKEMLPLQNRAYVTTDPAFADDVRVADEAFSGFMQTATSDEMARAAHLGHYVPVMNRALVQALQLVVEYRDAYNALRGYRNPTVRTADPAPVRPPAPPPKPMTVEQMEAASDQRIKDAIAGLQAGRVAVPRNPGYAQ